MIDFWTDMTQEDVFKQWDSSYFNAIFSQRGLVNNSHFYSYIEWKLPKDASIKWKLSVGTFDLNSAKFKRFDETLPFPELLEAARASASLPVIFPTVNL